MVTKSSLVSKSIPDPSNNPNEDEVDDIANGTQISSSDDDWTWKTAALSEVWNDGEDLKWAYHGVLYEFTTLRELTPVILHHLNCNTNY